MTQHVMRLAPEYFSLVQSGQKTIEARLYDEKRAGIRVGDMIVFHRSDNEAQTCTVRVKALHRFATFTEMLKELPLESLGATDSGTFLHDLETFYPESEQKRFGVVGIEIEI